MYCVLGLPALREATESLCAGSLLLATAPQDFDQPWKGERQSVMRVTWWF